MALQELNRPSLPHWGPPTCDLTAETGDSWDQVLAKLNDMMEEVYAALGNIPDPDVPGLQLPVHAVADAPEGEDGMLAYFSDGDAGQPCLAVYSGDSYKVVSLGAEVSAAA